MTQELNLQQLSIQHLNEAVVDLQENRRQIGIAEITKNSNLLLKLKMQRKEITEKMNYWRTKVNNTNNKNHENKKSYT